jgi:hypothetical protein
LRALFRKIWESEDDSLEKTQFFPTPFLKKSVHGKTFKFQETIFFSFGFFDFNRFSQSWNIFSAKGC